jgi:hypothetical protein
MASDKLIQVGKKVGAFQHETDNTARYVAKNLPVIESSCDVLGRLYRYRLEFRLYNAGNARLSIRFFPKMKQLDSTIIHF